MAYALSSPGCSRSSPAADTTDVAGALGSASPRLTSRLGAAGGVPGQMATRRPRPRQSPLPAKWAPAQAHEQHARLVVNGPDPAFASSDRTRVALRGWRRAFFSATPVRPCSLDDGLPSPRLQHAQVGWDVFFIGSGVVVELHIEEEGSKQRQEAVSSTSTAGGCSGGAGCGVCGGNGGSGKKSAPAGLPSPSGRTFMPLPAHGSGDSETTPATDSGLPAAELAAVEAAAAPSGVPAPLRPVFMPATAAHRFPHPSR